MFDVSFSCAFVEREYSPSVELACPSCQVYICPIDEIATDCKSFEEGTRTLASLLRVDMLARTVKNFPQICAKDVFI